MNSTECRVAAIDLGASSGRVVAAYSKGERFQLREVHRFQNRLVRAGGAVCWDVLRLFDGVAEGLRRAEAAIGPLDCGVDSWAVDYELLDGDGALLGNPRSYRDPGTSASVEQVLPDVGREQLYAYTGSQVQEFNTVAAVQGQTLPPLLRQTRPSPRSAGDDPHPRRRLRRRGRHPLRHLRQPDTMGSVPRPERAQN